MALDSIGRIGFLQTNPITNLAQGFNTGFGTVQNVMDTSRANKARELFGQSVQAGQLNPLLAAASPELAQQFQQQQRLAGADLRQQEQLDINQAQEARAAEAFDIKKQGIADAEISAENQLKLESVARDAKTALDIQDPSQRQQFLEDRARRIFAENGDPSDTIAIMNMPFDQQNIALKEAFDAAVPFTELAKRDDQGATQFQKGEKGLVFNPNTGTFQVDPTAKAHLESLRSEAVIPPQLLTGLSPEVATKAQAAFTAAGGGKDGMSAYEKVIGSASESEKRLASPQILKASFPRASEAELSQLQGIMDAAKTTESGLKAAGKLREEQRRDKKGKVFQKRAVDLLTGILQSDELNDVLGSIEGSIDARWSDSEAELISDITEAGDILTADNLDLMSGVLSESDIGLLKNLAGGALNRKRSETRFRADVQKLVDKLSAATIQTADDIQAARASNQIQALTDEDLDAQIAAAEARGEL